ncbi:MAG: ParB/RepB/Spo0J family partition protein [Thiobacillus sp.]|nr:ParB/RepB/Spo0J family partition protein [Thiobacillus sp.]
MTSRQTARKTLERRLSNCGPWRGPVPDTIKRSEIETLEGVFQYRNPLPHKSDAHKRRLGRNVKRTGEALGRLLVFWAGNAWVCIDGHHRLAAYEQHGLVDVPVEVFAGELHEAVRQALLRNTEDKLPVEDRERTAAAWGLVTTWNEAYSKAEISGMAGVSPSTVSNMRNVFKKLKTLHPRHDLSAFSWKQAQELAKGNERQDCGDEGKQVAAIRDKLIKAGLSAHLKRLDLVVKAFKEIDEDLPSGLRAAIDAEEDEAAFEDTEEAPAGTHRLPFPEPSKGNTAAGF